MSYTDIDRPTVQPGSIAAAVLINGGAVLAILFAGSTLVEKIKDKPIQTQWFDNPPVKPAEPPTTEKPGDTTEQTLPRDTHRDDKKPQTSENDLGGTVAGTAGGGTLTEPVEPKVEPIAIPVPLIKTARLDPRYTSALQPEYPQSMARAGQSGSVTVRVRIGSDGRVKEVQILNSASDEFAEATKRQALRKWRFIPATRDGQAEESWREMTVKFEMPD